MRRLPQLTALLLTACSAAGEGPDRFDLPSSLQVWAHSADVEMSARLAADRLHEAAGLVVEVNLPGMSGKALPVFKSEQHGDWGGVYNRHGWIAVDAGLVDENLDTIVLHELMHAFGAGHVEQGFGVMSPAPLPYPHITEADLVELCGQATCSHMQAEMVGAPLSDMTE